MMIDKETTKEVIFEESEESIEIARKKSKGGANIEDEGDAR